MKAGDVMTLGAATVRPEASLLEAARLMLEHRISGLPVVDAAGKLVGIVTEQDFLRGQGDGRPRWIELLLSRTGDGTSGANLETRRVEEVMTAKAVTVEAGTPLAEVVELLERHRIRRVPVVAEGKVVGIVSVANLLLALTRRGAAAS
jgi:CBS domain-containing protein